MSAPSSGSACFECGEPGAKHYLGGGMWFCFRHWLAAFGLVKR